MIILRLSGGLGNQMFQYAAGLALARRHGAELRFDLEWFEANRLHQGLELTRVFGLQLPVASPLDRRKVLGWFANPMLRRIFSRRQLAFLRPSRLVVEPHFHYWQRFENLPANVYLDGYWQSERYFAPIADEIRRTFQFFPSMDARSSDLAQKMAAETSVSLHVRRGDFFREQRVSRVHGVDLAGYYKKAVQALIERLAKPRFYIFSDEPKWVRQHLDIACASTIVDHNSGADSYRDMQLMSLCKHHIIANSTFSWWGAWLNPNPDKIVIAPRQWFNVSCFDTRDLYPPNWLVL